jgi:predicted RNA methylase
MRVSFEGKWSLLGSGLRWATSSIRRKGVVQTVKIGTSISLDLLFDLRYGTDTIRWVEKAALDTTSGNKQLSAPYQATKARPLLRLLDTLALPKDAVFVDIGSGKGRVLLIASAYGFRKVIGIEFSRSLCEIARSNVELFSKKVPLKSPIEVIEADATKYWFEPSERVFYMYNPFDAPVLAQVLANLRASLEINPRKIWLIYNTPMHHDAVIKSKVFLSHCYVESGGTEFRVYQT